jgi:5-formyltetrahydrofolate cyclo-ligase
MKFAMLGKKKDLLRRELRQLLNDIPVAERKRKSAGIVRRLCAKSFFKKARTIMSYVALPTEVQTRTLIRQALRAGKTVYVPCVNVRTRTMRVCPIRNYDEDLRPGAYGIPEPVKRPVRRHEIAVFDLIVVPGLGFDRRGGRLGRGAGYYDRFLKSQKGAFKVGLSFREQVVRKIPMTRQDASVDCVMTD